MIEVAKEQVAWPSPSVPAPFLLMTRQGKSSLDGKITSSDGRARFGPTPNPGEALALLRTAVGREILMKLAAEIVARVQALENISRDGADLNHR